MSLVEEHPSAGVALQPVAAAACGSAPVFLMNSDLATGGTERQFSAVAKALHNTSIDIHLGCMGRRGTFLDGIDEIAEFNVGGSFLSWQAQRSRRALAQHLRTLDVAVAHSFDFYANVMLIPVARWVGVPVVIGSQRQLGDLATPLQRAALHGVFRLCTRVICNSRAAAARLVSEGLPQSRIVVIANGLSEEAFVQSKPPSERRSTIIRIGLIARMNHPAKNQELFLRAASRLAGHFPEAEFVLVGDGARRGGLEQLAGRLDLGSRVHFWGEIKDIPSALASFDISVVASDSESLSNVILESMAASKPVVATRVGGNAELVQEGITGLLIPPRDVNALAHGLEILLRNPHLRQAMGENAQIVARRDFSLRQISRQYEELYSALLAEKGWKHAARVVVPKQAKAFDLLKIAIVGPSLRYVGGQSVQADLLMRHWRGDPDIEVTFVPIDPKLPCGMRWIERLPYLRTLVRTPFYLCNLWRELHRVKAVHIFSASYWSFLLGPAPAWLVARLLGKGSLINYRSGEAPDHLRRSPMARTLLRHVDQLVVPSRHLVDVFERHGLIARVIPNIVDLTQFSYRDRIPLQPRLICTRMFEPYYRVELVVRAFSQVTAEFPDARLCLVGSGSQENEIRSLAGKLNLRNIEFAGIVPRDQIGHFYGTADIFVNASQLDNMPVSILEAFASGTPVVTTAPEGMRYIAEHERTALLCEPGDSRALAANVIRLLREPELALRLAQNAHSESRRYRWEAVRGQWLDAYRSVCSGHGTSDTQSSIGRPE